MSTEGANLLFRQRIDYDDGAIVEMVLWRVSSPVVPSRGARHGSASRSGGRNAGVSAAVAGASRSRGQEVLAPGKQVKETEVRTRRGQDGGAHRGGDARATSGDTKVTSVRALAKGLRRDYGKVMGMSKALRPLAFSV
jgi:hypothetical protein